jgi:hypothetical protein
MRVGLHLVLQFAPTVPSASRDPWWLFSVQTSASSNVLVNWKSWFTQFPPLRYSEEGERKAQEKEKSMVAATKLVGDML